MEVPFNKENVMKCICGQCPVQTKSERSREKMAKAKEAMSNPDSNPGPDLVPGLYCGSGKASCQDLDMKQTCICGTCPLWPEYKLPEGNPKGYYCRDGKAQ